MEYFVWMIVENGFGAYDKFEEDGMIHDDYRIDYYRNHTRSLNLWSQSIWTLISLLLLRIYMVK